MRPCSLVVAATAQGGIGHSGKLPWTLPADLAYFRDVTSSVRAVGAKQNAVVMGRKTWASIPEKFRPLRGRLNVVLSSGEEAAVRAAEGIPPGVLLAGSLGAALAALAPEGALGAGIETVFVIGGAAAYAEVLAGGSGVVCDTIHLTRILADVPCDVFIPPIDDALYALDEMQVRGGPAPALQGLLSGAGQCASLHLRAFNPLSSHTHTHTLWVRLWLGAAPPGAEWHALSVHRVPQPRAAWAAALPAALCWPRRGARARGAPVPARHSRRHCHGRGARGPHGHGHHFKVWPHVPLEPAQ
jgi:dihydrofolate reductase